jgi:hypothetical protein
VTAERVARFRPNVLPDDPIYTSVPDDGLCLNVFLLLSEAPDAATVLMGRIDPDAGWDEIGGMYRARIEQMGDRWMLPCRQLFLFEGPDTAARWILKTQLDVEIPTLGTPSIHSEAWKRPRPVGTGLHWDLSFLYRATWPKGHPVRAGPWRELRFMQPGALDPAEVGRGHLDVLALAGYRVRT